MKIFGILFAAIFPLASYAADIAVVTLAAGTEYNKAVTTSIENKKQYCQKHGYDFICVTESLDTTRPIPWSKVKLLLNVLSSGKYKWVFWTDADSLIMNDSIRLEELIDENYDFIVCGDYHAVDPIELDVAIWKKEAPHVLNINTGEFFLRASTWSVAFLEECYKRDEFIYHSWWEQAAITDILTTDQNKYYLSKTKIIPYRLMNSLPEMHSIGPSFTPTTYKYGDFILHFPGIRGLDQLKAVLEKHAQEMVHDRKEISLSDYLQMYGYRVLFPEEKIELSSIQQETFPIRRVLEIGFNDGNNAVNILNYYPQSHLHAVDRNLHFYTNASMEYCTRWFDKRFTFYSGNLNIFLRDLNEEEKFDLIFINQNFFETKCKQDITLCAHLAHSNTKLLISNYHLPGVHQAVLDCLKQGIIEIDETHETKDEEGNIKAWIEGRYTPLD